MNFDTIDKISLYRLLVALTAGFLILIGCIIVLKPFLPAVMLALIFSLTTWPAYSWLNMRLGGNKVRAAALMTLTLAACFIVPLVFLGSSVAENFSKLLSGLMQTLDTHTEQAPAWVLGVPVFGVQLGETWQSYAGDREKLLQTLTEYAGPASQFAIRIAGALGRGLIDLTLGVFITYFFFRYGVQASVRISNLITSFAGDRGRHLLDLAKTTMIGVIYGVLGTAIAQGAFAGLGFWIAGVPAAAFLGLLTFFFSLVPFGPPLIWIPATLWLITEQEYYAAIFMAIYGACVISLLDNVIRPYFISVGSKLHILLVLMGIIGGILAFGFIGLFIGPVLLAIAMTLVMEWSTHPHQTHRKSPLLDNQPAFD